MEEGTLIDIFTLLLLILIAPLLSKAVKMPVIAVEVILGILAGPGLLGMLGDAEWLSTMATMGFIYLMFVVGLETEVSLLRANIGKIALITAGSLLAPLLLGYVIALAYGLPPEFIAIALSTTSMGVVLPIVRELPASEDFSQALLGSSVLVDVVSMFALAFVIEEEFLATGQLLLLMGALAGSLVGIYFLKRMRIAGRSILEFIRLYHVDIRFALMLIFGFAMLAEFVGVHAILGSFFAGLLVSEFEEKIEDVIDKLLSFGHGFFIPVFFIAVGTRTNPAALLGDVKNLEVLAALIATGFLGKLVGASAASRLAGFTKRESITLGFAMSARLSLIIASAELGLAVGIIGREIYSALVMLAIVSVVLSPWLAKVSIGVRAANREEGR